MLGRDVFWAVPYDRNISAATQLGMPVVVAKPQAKAAESLTEMAYALSGVRQQESAAGGQRTKDVTKGGFLSRILGNVTEDKTELSSVE
jgi:MinD-like ATPase involved in chromosome partitioning or flagellar assembly